MEGHTLSSGSQDKGAKVLWELMREYRQSAALFSSLFRVATTRAGMAVSDVQVLDLLDLIGPATAGQLAELTGLTTGAITRLLDRLEKAGLIRRERDRSDARKTIVRLSGGRDDMQQVRSILDSVGRAWAEVAARYDEERIAFLLEFLRQSNMLARQELLLLQREAPAQEEEIFSAPLEGESGRLVIACGGSRLSLRAAELAASLYQARFEGPIPKISVKDGAVTMRYPRRLLGLSGQQGRAEVALNVAIPWRIVIQGGAAEIEAGLRDLDLARLEIMGGFNVIRLELGAPSAVVPIAISAGASEIEIWRPAGVAVRTHFTGWVSELVFDGQAGSGIGPDARLQSPGFDPSVPYYDIDITGHASKVTITSH